MIEIGPSKLNLYNDCTNHVHNALITGETQLSRNDPQLYHHLPTSDKYPRIFQNSKNVTHLQSAFKWNGLKQ